MEAMAVGSDGGVRSPFKGRCAVDTFRVSVVRVAGRAYLHHSGLITFPGRHFVDVFVAVLALDVIDGMGACTIICRFPLVASIAAYRLRFFCFLMGSEIHNIPVTAVTRISPMDRLGKLPFVDLISMPPAQ